MGLSTTAIRFRPNNASNGIWNQIWGRSIETGDRDDCCHYQCALPAEALRFDRDIGEIERAVVASDIAGMHLTRRDRVLEIGPGPGTYTLPIAKRVHSLTAVEPLYGMRQVLLENAAASGLANISVVPALWEQVDIRRDLSPPYDLVLAAFSLDMPDLCAAVRKMTAAAAGNICLYWFAGDTSCDRRCSELWPVLYGRAYRPQPKFDTLVNVLSDMGIYPRIQFFPFYRRTVFPSLDAAADVYRRRFQVAPGSLKMADLRRHLKDVLVPEQGRMIRHCHARCVKLFWNAADTQTPWRKSCRK